MKPFTSVEETEDWRLRNCGTCPFSGLCDLERTLDATVEADGELEPLVLVRTGLLVGPEADCLERRERIRLTM